MKPAARTLLAFHAHPDDESSKTAATVARYVDDGVRCVLVMATGGEEGDILNPDYDPAEAEGRMAEVRREELEKAAAVIGYNEIIHLGFRDSGMAESEANNRPEAFVNATDDDALEPLVTAIRQERPQVMLGYDEHRYYPHPDHVRVHELAPQAFRAAADADLFPNSGPPWEVTKLYAPVFSFTRLQSLHDAMESRGLESPFVRWLERRDPNDPEPPINARIPIHGTLSRSRDALREHRTQVDPNGLFFKMPDELVLEVYPYEDYVLLETRIAPPTEVEEDLFAGVE